MSRITKGERVVDRPLPIPQRPDCPRCRPPRGFLYWADDCWRCSDCGRFFSSGDIAAIPHGSDGKFRVRRCLVVGEKTLAEIGLEPASEPETVQA